jgi:hypothetical protein
MSYLTKSAMRSLGNSVLAEQQRHFAKSARNVLAEAVEFDPDITYDVFLSHSSRDKPLVLGVKQRLEDEDLEVYVDWIDDAELDRREVTPENAARLRVRMKRCRSLLYMATDNAASSKWMPWEVGYFDGIGNGEIGILPVLDNASEEFEGLEFLGLYSVVDLRPTKGGPIAFFSQRDNGDAKNFKRLIRPSA